jgi:hypothetical protein
MRKQSEGGSSFIIPNTEDKKKIQRMVGRAFTDSCEIWLLLFLLLTIIIWSTVKLH